MLGDDAHAALGRGEPVPVRLACSGELGTLIRLFLLADDVLAEDASAALAPVSLTNALAAGLLAGDPTPSGTVRTLLDVRPVDLGGGNRWILADLDGALRPHLSTRDHVLGVGHASVSLLRAIPATPVGTVLDLGTGSGVQALRAVDHSEHVTGTDVNPRAAALARATMVLNGVADGDVDLLTGSWFEPVAGRTFDLVVANPPFVVGEGRVHNTYRDSGLDLDGASAMVISRTPDFLAPGGTAVLLASWLHRRDEDWRHRVASWLPDHGVDAWVVQRDVAEPALYVGTWLRDSGEDPRDPAAAQRALDWLTHLHAADVEGIGFGFVFLRRTDAPTDLLAEDLTHGFDDPLGDEAAAYFERVAWLREHDVLQSRLRLAPATALERVSVPGEYGWDERVVRVHRGDGPRWQHEIDDLGAALLAGMNPGGLALEELIALLAAAHDLDCGELEASAVPLVHALVRHGIALPG
ncbi:class I SAM-dependent methyltransferase [Rhodococcus rhodnii]|uniref:Class I SAM-dependent methyltransferase n=2 Tax=Rhodococcus rhodnii TaxID=38312 RepID=A0A6P2CLE8_9NOCA|nr:class I SAM-dependent methyltransferase [Rhodococcus rhodnii]